MCVKLFKLIPFAVMLVFSTLGCEENADLFNLDGDSDTIRQTLIVLFLFVFLPISMVLGSTTRGKDHDKLEEEDVPSGKKIISRSTGIVNITEGETMHSQGLPLKCSRCGEQIQEQHNYCQNCGDQIEHRPESSAAIEMNKLSDISLEQVISFNGIPVNAKYPLGLFDSSDVMDLLISIRIKNGIIEIADQSEKIMASNKRAGEVFKARLIENRTLEDIGSGMNISRERVRQICFKFTAMLPKLNDSIKFPSLFARMSLIEERIYDYLVGNDGLVEIGNLAAAFDYRQSDVKFWIVFNQLTGLLNYKSFHKTSPLRKPHEKVAPERIQFDRLFYPVAPERIQFGRIIYVNDTLILNNLAELNHLSESNESIRILINDILEKYPIMSFKEFFKRFRMNSSIGGFEIQSQASLSFNQETELKIANLLQSMDWLTLMNPPTMLNEKGLIQNKEWFITSGLTKATVEISRAILYYKVSHECTDGLSDIWYSHGGLRIDFIYKWLIQHSEYNPSIRSLTSVLERHSDIFTLTDYNHWGLLPIGAEEMVIISKPPIEEFITFAIEEISKSQGRVKQQEIVEFLSEYFSSSWVSIKMDQEIQAGNILNVSPYKNMINHNSKYNLVLPDNILHSHDSVREYIDGMSDTELRKTYPLARLVAALEDEPMGLTESEIISRILRHDKKVSLASIGWYLKSKGFTDIFEQTAEGKYILVRQSENPPADTLIGLKSIDILRQVLVTADEPLSLDEILYSCSQYKEVRYSAIIGYLSQKHEFIKNKENKYFIDSSEKPNNQVTPGGPSTVAQFWCKSCNSSSLYQRNPIDGSWTCQNCNYAFNPWTT